MEEKIRTAALVVRAFNVEISRIQDQTSDQKTAMFRLQFWHDTLQSIYKKSNTIRDIPANPIAKELYKVCTQHNLSKRHLEKLINSRSSLLKIKHFNKLEDLEKYSDDAVSTIYYILLSVAKITNVHADHAASHIGKAQGITNFLRSMQVSSHHKMVCLPMDVLMKHSVSQEDILRGVNDEKLRNVVFEIASRANSHLQKARSIKVPKEANQIFLPAAAVDSYLKRLENSNFDVYSKHLNRRNSLLPFWFYFNSLTCKY